MLKKKRKKEVEWDNGGERNDYLLLEMARREKVLIFKIRQFFKGNTHMSNTLCQFQLTKTTLIIYHFYFKTK